MQVRRAFRANVLIYGRLWLQRPLLWAFGATSSFWAFVAPSSSSMGVWCSVVLLGVCGSVVLFYGRLCLRRLFSAFWDNVLIYGRLWLRRPRLWAFGSPSSSFELFWTNASLEGVSGQRPHIWAFAAPSSSFKGVCASARCGRLCLLFVAVAGLYVFGFGEKSPRRAHFSE